MKQAQQPETQQKRPNHSTGIFCKHHSLFCFEISTFLLSNTFNLFKISLHCKALSKLQIYLSNLIPFLLAARTSWHSLGQHLLILSLTKFHFYCSRLWFKMDTSEPPTDPKDIFLRRWEIENDIKTVDSIFKYDKEEQQSLRGMKPWERDPNYFKVYFNSICNLNSILGGQNLCSCSSQNGYSCAKRRQHWNHGSYAGSHWS